MEEAVQYEQCVTNLFSELFIFDCISFIIISDGRRRAFCISTKKGLPEPNIRTWQENLILQTVERIMIVNKGGILHRDPLYRQHETCNYHHDRREEYCCLKSPADTHGTVNFFLLNEQLYNRTASHQSQKSLPRQMLLPFSLHQLPNVSDSHFLNTTIKKLIIQEVMNQWST